MLPRLRSLHEDYKTDRPRLLIVEEHHGKRHIDASTLAKLYAALKHIFKERYNQKYYVVPEYLEQDIEDNKPQISKEEFNKITDKRLIAVWKPWFDQYESLCKKLKNAQYYAALADKGYNNGDIISIHEVLSYRCKYDDEDMTLEEMETY